MTYTASLEILPLILNQLKTKGLCLSNIEIGSYGRTYEEKIRGGLTFQNQVRFFEEGKAENASILLSFDS